MIPLNRLLQMDEYKELSTYVPKLKNLIKG